MIPISTLQKEEILVIEYQKTKCPIAFGKLYEMFYASLYDYTRTITKSSDDAFDITQETFIKVAQEIHKLRQPITFRFWLFRIAKNQCLFHLKHALKNSSEEYVKDIVEQNYDTSEAEEKENQYVKLEEIMKDLTSEEQLLLQYKYGEGKSIKELMSSTQLGSSAIKMKLMRARKKLQTAMN